MNLKILFFLLFQIFILTSIEAQACFAPFFEAGKEALESLKFEKALSQFKAAKICEDKPADIDIQEWIEQARSGQVRALKGLLMAARSQLIFPEDPTTALNLAIRAYEAFPSEDTGGALRTILEKKGAFAKNILRGHSDAIYAARFSPDGQYIVSASTDSTLRLWSATGEHLNTFKEPKSLETVTFSHDSQQILSGGWEGTINIRSLDGTLLKKIGRHKYLVRAIAPSPDGQHILSCDMSSIPKLWDSEGQLLDTLIGHRESWGVFAVAFSPDGNYMATGGGFDRMKLWDLQGNELQSFKGHRNGIKSICFSPDGQSILSGGWDGMAKLWDLEGNLIREYEQQGRKIYAVAFSPDGQSILVGGNDKTATLWSIDGTLLQTFKGHKEIVSAVDFSPDGQTILTAGMDGTIRLYPINGLAQLSLKGKESRTGSTEGVISPDGKFILTKGKTDNNLIQLWTIEGVPVRTFEGHTDYITTLAFSPDGKFILSGSQDAQAKLWTVGGELIHTFRPFDHYVSQVGFSPDGQFLWMKGYRETRLFKKNGSLVNEFTSEYQHATPTIVFSAESKAYAAIYGGNDAQLWSVEAGLIAELKGHTDRINAIDISSDGKYVLTGGHDRTVRLWDHRGALIRTMPTPQHIVSVAISPDGQKLLAGNPYGLAELWSLEGKLLQTLHLPDYSFYTVGFSPDGQYLLTQGFSSKAQLWSMEGVNMQNFFAIASQRPSTFFAPDGRSVLTRESEARVRLWPRWDYMLDSGLVYKMTPEELAEFDME